MPSITTLRTVALYIPTFSGSLSILGSSSIIYSIYKQRHVKLKDPQHRILLGMSIFDIFYSLCKATTFLLYPSSLGIPAFGNLSTCTMQGFFTQFSYAVGLYNLMLSLYYYLTIVKGMKRREFSRIIEKVCHGFIVILTLTFASVGAGIGLYNPTPAFCFIAPYPYGCTRTNTCERFGDSFGIYYEMFAQLWIQIAYVGIIFTNASIWWYVRSQERSVLKYTQPSAELEQRKKRTKHARKVLVQSLLYVGAFLLTWTWATVFHLTTWISGKSVFWPVLLINVFIPLQGWWNAFIYARPRFLRLKERGEKLTCSETLKLVFLPEQAKKERSNFTTSATVSRSLNASNISSSMNVSSSIKLEDGTATNMSMVEKEMNGNDDDEEEDDIGEMNNDRIRSSAQSRGQMLEAIKEGSRERLSVELSAELSTGNRGSNEL